MASFFITVVFLPHNLDRLQAPTQRPIIDQHPVEQTAYRREIKDNRYKSVCTVLGWYIKGTGLG